MSQEQTGVPEAGRTDVLSADAVEKVYNQGVPGKDPVTAVDGVSLSIEENEFVLLVGPSGCGKTTTLHMFAGLEKPTAGNVLHNGEPITEPSSDRAVVFQQFNLFPWRTVYQNVKFGLEMKGYEEDRQRETANRYIDLVGLGGFENNYPNELSGGMQQRVGIARALSVDPEVLLMDEPFGALDAQTRQLMQEELLQIWEMEKKTVLFVTHDLDEAILLADRILVMGTNPRTIQGEWDIPFDRPRYDRDIEGTDEFARIKGEIWSTLKKDIKIEES